MMGSTYENVQSDTEAEWHLAYAQNIMSVESEIGTKLLVQNPKFKYWTDIKTKTPDGEEEKTFLQVQNMNESYYDDIRRKDEEKLSEEEEKDIDEDKDGIMSVPELQKALKLLDGPAQEVLLRKLGLAVQSSRGYNNAPQSRGYATDGPENFVFDGSGGPAINSFSLVNPFGGRKVNIHRA
eukprot:gb/GEZN01022648.1/.p1 GENE.gb/GEZN01022648.1/~~gb/GEZN01022648.1/.p1  ORF type:complete len:198 (-),score=34.00 gb/GEZN01022648.1/:24-566(-)